MLERIHPQDRPLAQELIEEVSKTGSDFETRYRLVMQSGVEKHIHVRAHALRDSSGNIEFVGAVTDITERKIAEDKIRGQEMEFRLILDLAPQLIAVYGPNRERLYANRTALDYLGISLDEWRQKSFAASAHPDDSERLKTCTDHAFINWRRRRVRVATYAKAMGVIAGSWLSF